MNRALAACALFFAGCAGASRVPGPSAHLLQAPFYPGDNYQCGPASLASVLAFWKRPAAPDELKKEIYHRDLQGSLAMDLLLAARKRGLKAEMATGDWERLRSEVRAGRPAIALLNLGYRALPKGHFVVVTGLDDATRRICVHSGTKADDWMSYRSFVKKWERADRTLLLFEGESQ